MHSSSTSKEADSKVDLSRSNTNKEPVVVVSFCSCMQTEYVLSLLPAVAQVLHSPEPFDIRREAAAYLLHMALNHGKRYLQIVAETKPSVIEGMLDMLEQNKYDRVSVLLALDFLTGVLESLPGGRVEVFKRDGIAKIESAQFLHDLAVDDLISWMVSHFFDDLIEEEDAAEDGDEACERVAAEEKSFAAQLSRLHQPDAAF